MRNVALFIAMSLDGYIAKKDGSVDWLQGQEAGQNDMVSYQKFIQDIDTVIMGWNTYHQIATELSSDHWFYEHLDSYIFTHRKLAGKENIHFIQGDICESILHMKRQEGKGIWICGGADIIQPLIERDIIDTYHISVIPIILGNGISLFQGRKASLKLKLTASESYNGITDLIYKRR
ncbi:dihydrofolate reductase family protein [[Clostridium] innocuum]|nr:dihydrofolate reductase [Erysipelotrichaceae bacterium]MCR0381578.1 dihydrofolate reductase family protein [[Clostridium] innocuum]MCR0413014.1 dihydrofolate reductase family protein [[Clostridium] innocuum]MCR0534125.1 dihydrofolate reductase family protein [[Clostridium] innocuum]MCR0539017.1 dihydrofolate reductase family protein [[Clostridium] innocuum]